MGRVTVNGQVDSHSQVRGEEVASFEKDACCRAALDFTLFLILKASGEKFLRFGFVAAPVVPWLPGGGNIGSWWLSHDHELQLSSRSNQ